MALEKNGKKEQMSKCENCANDSYCHHCGHGGWHFILRVVLGIIILVCVFWGGFQLGLIIGASNGGYGYGSYMMNSGYGARGMMRGYLNGYNGYQYGPGMMGGWSYQAPTSTK